MMIDLGWIAGWILAGVGAYLAGAPFIIMLVGIFLSHLCALIAIRAEMAKIPVMEGP